MISVQSQASIIGEASTSERPLNIKTNRRRNTSHYRYDDNDADGQVRCRLSESVCTDMTSLLTDGHDAIGGCVPMTAVAFDNILQVNVYFYVINIIVSQAIHQCLVHQYHRMKQLVGDLLKIESKLFALD
jgi:hypothetical protein